MVFPTRFFNQPIEPARGNIRLNLAVPLLGVEFGKPSAKRGSLSVGQFSDSVFNLLHSIHSGNINHKDS